MTLTLVGRDNNGMKKQLETMVANTPAEGKVTFVDQILFDRLYDFMMDYQVFIHPSCYADDRDCEGGAPVVLLDAQATGMPVIASTHCDIPEEVIDGVTGILAAEKDVKGLVLAVKKFYEMDNPAFQEFSLAARKHVEQSYSVQKSAEALRGYYQELLESQHLGSF